MTTHLSSLPHPAAKLREQALRCAGLRTHRAQVTSWLRATGLATVEQLFDAIGGRHTSSTAVLLADHRRGVQLASTIILGAKVVMLASIARHAPGESSRERFQVTVEAFLSSALPSVRPTHECADAQLYWITLRTVAKLREPFMARELHETFTAADGGQDGGLENIAGEDVRGQADEYLTKHVLLDWALARGVIAAQDHQALVIRFGGDSVLPVRQVAALMGVTENNLESRLRRAEKRLRDAVSVHRDDLDRACIEAHWSGTDGRVAAGARVKNGAAA